MSQYLNNDRRSVIANWPDGYEIIAARSTTESQPAYIIPTGDADTLLTFFRYTDTVSSCTVQFWYRNNGVWYAGTDTDDGTALTGSNEVREWAVSRHAHVGFTVSAIAGGGTVAVRVEALH